MTFREDHDPDFEIGKRRGSGLQGVVWEGTQKSLSRAVAVKFIHPHMAAATDVLEHARGLARANGHPNIVSVYGVTSLNCPETNKLTDAVILEWLEGKTLGETLHDGVFSAKEAFSIIEGLCAGLERLHSKNVTHSDFHAGNVILIGNAPKIIDVDYSQATSLRLLTTVSREDRLQQDINALAVLAIQILRRSAVDIQVVECIQEELRAANDVAVISDLIRRAEEMNGKGANARGRSEPDNSVEPLLASIVEQRSNQDSLARRFMASFRRNIDFLNPQYSQPFDEPLLIALEQTIGPLCEFAKVSNAVSEMNAERATLALYKHLGQFRERYEVAPGFSGMTYSDQFDFYKFLGHELLVTLIASLMGEERWELIVDVLKEELFINTGRRGGEVVDFATLSTYVQSFDSRNERLQLQRASIHSDILKARHAVGPLAELSPFERFCEADFLLFLRHPRWRPWSTLYLQSPPRFLIEAVSQRQANRVLLATGIASVAQLCEEIKKREATFAQIWSAALSLSPLIDFDLSTLGTRY